MPTLRIMSLRNRSTAPRESRPPRKPERAAATPLHPGLVALARLLALTAAWDAHTNAGLSAEAATTPAPQETSHDQD